MKTLIVTPLVMALAACATPASQEKTFILPQSLATLSANAPLACQFQKSLDDGKATKTTQWYFWRSPDRTENRDELTNQGEIWSKDAAGRFFYARLFYNEKVVLEFAPGDLAALGTNVKWDELYSLIDTKKLGHEWPLTGTENVSGSTLEHYAGQLKSGNAITVDWLPQLKLAAGITKKQPEGLTKLSLSSCGAATSVAVKPITEAQLNDFRHIDFTDLGDMESDPMVQHLEKIMGTHEHEGH